MDTQAILVVVIVVGGPLTLLLLTLVWSWRDRRR